MTNSMGPTTELRKVPIGTINALVNILETHQSWIKLMEIIPKEINNTSIKKYKPEQITLVENASVQQKRSCTAIFFEEWGTSGKSRPTLQYLLQLLTEAGLYRAADYIAVDVLKGSPPARPDKGPAAKIDVSLTHLLNSSETYNKGDIAQPSSNGLDTLNKNLNDNIKYDKEDERNKEYLFDAKSGSDVNSKQSDVSKPTVESYINSSVSDMMQFSKSSENYVDSANQCYEIPAISVLLLGKTVESELKNESNKDISSKSNGSHRSTSPVKLEENFSMPITIIVDSMTESSSDSFSIPLSGDQGDLPKLSKLQGNSSEYNISGEVSASQLNLPALSALQTDSHNFIPSTSTNTSIPLTTSFLPVTSSSLNTSLPHYKYTDLQKATNSFPEQMYNKDDNSFVGKLGAGGYGQVYLANGLQHLQYPVAVKKLLFNTMDWRISEEVISKQFKTEVEILSNYLHDNVISLLGYSCDGPNYCLIYEYVDGGSLLENISTNSQHLTSTIRMNIAIGCATGIEHLHNSQETPLIHRDIKSANIILTKSFVPKLCDFGLIKLLPNRSFTTNVAGTNAYMAPEAFRGHVSVQMDVFSFGVVILELLTGLPPIKEGRSGIDIITYVEEMCTNGKIESLLDASAGPWDCSEDLYQLVLRCLTNIRNRPIISEVKQKLLLMM